MKTPSWPDICTPEFLALAEKLDQDMALHKAYSRLWLELGGRCREVVFENIDLEYPTLRVPAHVQKMCAAGLFKRSLGTRKMTRGRCPARFTRTKKFHYLLMYAKSLHHW